jgi:phosphoribosylformylglycinamidine (FGAM) synthase-like enzyme
VNNIWQVKNVNIVIIGKEIIQPQKLTVIKQEDIKDMMMNVIAENTPKNNIY